MNVELLFLYGEDSKSESLYLNNLARNIDPEAQMGMRDNR